MRYYGVSEAGKQALTQLCGNPIMLATQKGHGLPSKSIDKPTCFPICTLRVIAGVLPRLPLFRLSDAIGVGSSFGKPVEPFPLVGESESRSR
jgi:hypothetical protein